MRSDIMENHRMATLTRFATLALIAAPGAALAHTGIGSVHGFSAGLLHPLADLTMCWRWWRSAFGPVPRAG